MPWPRLAAASALVSLLLAPLPLPAEETDELLYGTEGNRLRRFIALVNRNRGAD